MTQETDRELLELAAKAAGIEGSFYFVNGRPIICKENPQQYGDGLIFYDSPPWNPLTDDGDALRLAVKLGITVEQWLYSGHVYAGFPGSAYADERHNCDKYAATRRAIVRAASEIGKAM